VVSGSAANPYADALDGLQIEDPVDAFFAFCRAREQVRVARDAGQPRPWSDDPVLNQGRFLNVFREDDRGTKAVIRFVKGAGPALVDVVHAAFFARWCNQDTTLAAIAPDALRDPERLRASDSAPSCRDQTHTA
jgi:hypothetical protein